jgi:hypothetical protein
MDFHQLKDGNSGPPPDSQPGLSRNAMHRLFRHAGLLTVIVCASFTQVSSQSVSSPPLQIQSLTVPQGSATTFNCGTGITCTLSNGIVTATATGGSGSGTVTVVGAGVLINGACVTGGGLQTVQTPSALCTLDSSGNVNVTKLTTGAGGGTTGAITLTGAASGNGVTLSVGTSTAAGSLTMPGATGNVDYSSALGTSGHCVQYGADGIGLTDAGAACGSGGGGGSGGSGITVYSGLAGISMTGATIYFPIGGGSLASATEATVQSTIRSATTISNLGLDISAALGTTIAANNIVVLTWRKNGSSTALTCIITNPAVSCSDTTHSFTTVAGDVLDVQAVFTGTISATPVFVINVQMGTSAGVPAATVPFTGWTLVNGAILSNFAGASQLGIALPVTGSASWKLATQSLTIPYTVTATMSCNQVPNAGVQVCGAWIGDGTKFSGIQLAIYGASGTAYELRIDTIATTTSNDTVVSGPTPGLQNPALFTLQIKNDGTTRTYSYYTGGAWVSFYTEAAGTFVTETVAGFGGQNQTTANAIGMNLLYWSVTNP